MTISDPDSQWEREEPQRTFIATMETLHRQGRAPDDLLEVMLVLSLSGMSKAHGARAVAARLMMLADKFAGEANRLEREARDAAAAGGASGNVH